MISAQARQMVIAVAGPMSLGDTIPRMVEKAARRLGWSYTRTYSVYRQRARIISAEEWLRLNEEAAEMAQREKARREALHENDLLARDVRARLGAAAAGSAAGLDGEGNAPGIERHLEQHPARPDLLKRKYWAG